MVVPIMNKTRLPANTLKAVTAAVLAAWISFEGFSAKPYIPTKNDVPTIGHGATHYGNGIKVKLTDPAITRAQAGELALLLLNQEYGACVQRSLGTTLVNQTELEIAVDFAGQYGCYTWFNSSMLKHLKTGNYKTSCGSYLMYKYAGGYDCSTPGNKRCSGVWKRQKDRYSDCMGAL